MYPTLLRDEQYPVKLATVDRVSPVALRQLVESGVGVIARVTIHTERGLFPLRENDRTSYPTGTFTTTLAGPDLRALYECGEVSAVDVCATYDMENPFAASMRAMLKARDDARISHSDDGEAFAKLIANSLAGKLAQREGGWERRSKLDDPGRWGEESIIHHEKARARRIRYMCGAAFEWVEESLPRGPHTACFAYLTAYGRQHVSRLIAACPPKTVVSVDTDGFWALDSAVDTLRAAGILDGEGPGTLRAKDSGRNARFLSARHYHIDGRWTLAGFSDFELEPDGLHVRHRAARPLIGHRLHGAPDRTISRVHVSPLPVDVEKGRIQPDGWVLPRHILAAKG